MLLCPTMGLNLRLTIMHSEGMAKPEIHCLVITFTLRNRRLDQYLRFGFEYERHPNTD